MKKIKNESCRVWIKIHNIEASFASIKLLLKSNLMCNVNVSNYDFLQHEQMKMKYMYKLLNKIHETSISYISKAYTLNKVKLII